MVGVRDDAIVRKRGATVNERIATPADQHTVRARTTHLDLEKQALRSTAHDSLRSRLERIIAGGGYYDNDETPIDRALLGYAAAVTKAVAVALIAETTSNGGDTSADIEFTPGDAARALGGLAALLTEADHFCWAISDAADHDETAGAAE